MKTWVPRAALFCGGGISALMGCLVASSCSDESPGVLGEIKAQVVYLDRDEVARNGGRAVFKVGAQNFGYLKDLKQLDGDFLKIVRGGELSIKDIAGSQIMSDKFEGGTGPNLRFDVTGGVVVPRDYSTLAMLSSYYQYEQVFANLGKVTGIKVEDFVAKSGKLKALFEPTIKLETDSNTQVASQKLNAAYVSGQKQFVLFQRSAVEKVPLAANLQVIMHEFGHAVFEQTFFQNRFKAYDSDQPNLDRNFAGRLEQEYAIRGLNEGFADFMSYGLVGSTDILRSSIDIEDKADQRDFSKQRFVYSDLGSEDASRAELCNGSFYCIGTLFAHSLYQAMQALNIDGSNFDARTGMSSLVVTAVSKAQGTLKTLSTDIYPLPNSYVSSCGSGGIKGGDVYNGKITGAFLNAFIANMPDNSKKALCDAFANNFGDVGFPTAARKGCP